MSDGRATSTTADDDAPLRGLWYAACPSSEVARGAVVRRILFGEPVAIGRGSDGAVFALRDVCPHRAAPLSKGRIISEGGTTSIECPYHGWRFQTADGRCALIPSLSADDPFDPSGIAAVPFSATEANGFIWIAPRDVTPPRAQAPAPALSMIDFGLRHDAKPQSLTVVDAHGPYDEAVIGLVDPAHTPFVHKQWWWRDGKPLLEKQKYFEPTRIGFRMPPHMPSSNSRIYGLLGGAPTTEIEFRLPGLRIETIRNRRHVIVSATAITPTDKNQSRIFHAIYWDAPLLSLLSPLINRMAASFLGQDGDILRAQAENLARERHRPLYAGDPDVPAQWFHALKRAWRAAPSPDAFDNPLTEKMLRWRT
ncbi:MAG: aromatic ring-hydroxylating dioxygenase subunit alpha [Pseudomonadota bacterium]